MRKTAGTLYASTNRGDHSLALLKRVPKEIPYSFTWAGYNQAQINEKRLFLQLLSDLIELVPEEPKGQRGRPKASRRQMLFSIVSKSYEGLSSRRLSSDLEFSKKEGYLNEVPHFNTLIKFLNDPELSAYLVAMIEASALPLKGLEHTFAADGSGLSSKFYLRWFDERLNTYKDKHDWIKIHIMCGVNTGIITSVKITDARRHDSPQFIPLLSRTAENFSILEVCADKAYSSRNNLAAVMKIGAIPFIPFTSQATGNAFGSQAWKKMYHYFHFHEEDFLKRYHQRSNVESVFSALKRKFSGNLMCRKEIGRMNEALGKMLCYNLCIMIREAYLNDISLELRPELERMLA